MVILKKGCLLTHIFLRAIIMDKADCGFFAIFKKMKKRPDSFPELSATFRKTERKIAV
jgi:hypothetical protein